MIMFPSVRGQSTLVGYFVNTSCVLSRHHASVDGRAIFLRCKFDKSTGIHQSAYHLVQIPVELLTQDLLSIFLLLPYGAVCVREMREGRGKSGVREREREREM